MNAQNQHAFALSLCFKLLIQCALILFSFHGTGAQSPLWGSHGNGEAWAPIGPRKLPFLPAHSPPGMVGTSNGSGQNPGSLQVAPLFS